MIKFFGGFLLGTAIGAAGGYYATKYTDVRRRKEEKKEKIKRYKKLKKNMIELFKEFYTDFHNEEYKLVRKFVVSNGNFAIKFAHFRYLSSKDKSIFDKFDLLENYNFIEIEKREGNYNLGKFNEEFIEMIQNDKKLEED